jgi:hypothetical protein
MLFGRPANLIVGTFQIVFGAIVVILAALVPPIIIPALVVAAIGAAFGAIVALIANQPPTLSAGDTYKISTPTGQPNYEATVATPPAATKPTVDPDAKA